MVRIGSIGIDLDDLEPSEAELAASESWSDPARMRHLAHANPGGTMQIQYLEIVTPNVDAVCATYERVHGVRFGEPEAGLGNARTAALAGGGRIGVRAPMHETEAPVVRPYLLVDDVEAAATTASEAGGEIAHPPLELPGHGTFAIYIQGGIHHGLWKV